MEKNFVTALTAQNATETTKTYTTVDYTVPQGVSKLSEVGLQISMAGMTTLEGISAILEIECDDSSQWGGTQQFVTDTMLPLTSGSCIFPARVHDVSIPVQAGAHLRFGVTFNTALTINPSWRVFGKFN